MAAATPSSSTAKYDLTSTLSKHLDLHLMFPLLEFIDGNELLAYDPTDIQRARLALVKPTNMVEYAIEIHQDLEKTTAVPPEMAAEKETIERRIDANEKLDQELPKFFADYEAGTYEGTFSESQPLNLIWLQENLGVDKDALEKYYRVAKFEYECGQYEAAAPMLTNFLLVEENKQPSNDLGFAALWGKFAALILLPNEGYATKWDLALVEFEKLKAAIDARGDSDKQQLQQRTWLLHWSLFVFWNHPKGRDLIIDAFLSEKYLQAIQINAPHLLRYLATAMIVNKRRRSELKGLERVIQQERYTYSDPVTKFLECLRVDFDFDGAQEMLGECQLMLKSDYFLCNCTDDFVKAARFFIFETYCRIHEKIDITGLATKLMMEPEDAELWIVNLIRGAQLDAKIDSKNNCVIMGSNFPSVYQQVIDKTKDLTIRTYQLANNVERMYEQQATAERAAAAR
eukprot:CAMPEP_0172617354 /NCGR_PEP_ID=MMETSP1068-20121228/70197_1 /TAXON_ID=35684 /ORGANISM="Pseudopedinella elastica, Strain CCMP716" /LENGTH=456 /DNA_ID=CAMNT_0013423099 /DNA_START=90 /DNA_END=1460 /DNA_ORIENTATION=+